MLPNSGTPSCLLSAASPLMTHPWYRVNDRQAVSATYRSSPGVGRPQSPRSLVETVNKHGSPYSLRYNKARTVAWAILSPRGARIQESEFVVNGEHIMGEHVGIDVSKEHLDWVVGAMRDVERVPNSPSGVRRMVKALHEFDIASIIVESTGGYERRLTEALTKAQLPVILVNPWRVRRFGEGLGVLAKTDPLDARILALFGERARPERRPLPDPKQREMADLVRRRRQLISIIVAEKNRLDTASKAIRRDIQAVVKLLERRVAKLDEKVDAAIDGDDEKAEIRTRLQTVPSVGPGVARTLIVDLPELGHLGRRQICSLVGLAPFAKDSGKKVGTRRIKAGRAAPRSALYLAAMNGARFNPVLKAMYERMLEQGKPKKVALIALARKLLTILNAMARDRKDWQQMSA